MGRLPVMFLVCSFVNCGQSRLERPVMAWLPDLLGDWITTNVADRIPRRARWWVFALVLVLPMLLLALALRLLLP
jgi:hypothetical protein